MFGEIGCLCTTRDQNWTRDAPVAMIQYGISGLNLFQCVVGLKMENGFNFSMQEQSSYVSQLAGKFASNA